MSQADDFMATMGGGPQPQQAMPSQSAPTSLSMMVPPTQSALSGDARERMINAWMTNPRTMAPRHVAEGIVDRAYNFESKGDPTALGDYRNGVPTSGGLYQEHDSRWTGLKAFAERKGTPWTDFDTQNEYAIWEATQGDSIAAKHWPEIKASTDRKTAYENFTKYFERPKNIDPWSGTVVSKGKWSVDDKALASAASSPNTAVMWMSPGDYLGMLNPDDASDRKQAELEKSLGAGGKIDEIPQLDVRQANGKAQVFDQDGRNRALFAQKEGVDLIPVAIKGLSPDKLPAYLTDMNGKQRPFDFAPVKLPEAPLKTEAAKAAPPPPSRLDRIGTGIKDVGLGLEQMAARIPAGSPTAMLSPTDELAFGGGDSPEARQRDSQAVDTNIAQREKTIEAERAAAGQTGTDWYRVGGNVLATAPLMAAVPAGGGIPAAAVAGGLGAAMMPVTQGDFATNKLRDVALGSSGGALAGAGGNVLASLVKPYIQPAAQRLMAAGVDKLLPGQLKGGWRQGLEEVSKSVPFSGAAVTGAAQRAVESFNHAGYNKALAPLGEKFAGNAVGWEGIDQLEQQIGAHYDRLLPKIQMKIDAPFARDYANLANLVKELPEDAARQFDQIMKNRLWGHLGSAMSADGITFKGIESELGQITRELLRSDNFTQRQLGKATQTVLGMLRENLERVNPAQRAELQQINKAWAGFARLRDAAANRVKSLGVFTPGDLLTAEKRLAGKRIFARGDGLMQDLAKDAETVIGSKTPDSGTALRYATYGEAASVPVQAVAAPLTLAATVAGHLLHAAAYSSPGQNILRAVAGTGFPRGRNVIANVLRRAGAAAGVPAGTALATAP